MPEEKARVVFCDVGQGDGALIIKGETQVLIDVGPDNGQMEKCLSRYLPFWDRDLEMIIVSHWDADHSGGLKGILEKYKVGSLYANQLPADKFEQKFYSADLRQDDSLRISGIEFDVRWPEEISGDSNTDSVVMEVKLLDKNYLFTGDAPVEIEQKLVWRNLINKNTDGVLKVSHHGSNTGTSEELLDYWKPGVAVISVGKNNKFGHPNREVIDRLKTSGVREIWRTDLDGDFMPSW